VKTKPSNTSKVVPFTGEFYPETPEVSPQADNTPSFLVMVAAALVAGLSIGAIAVYQSSDQVQLRQMKLQSEQLQQVKTQVCK